MEFSWVFAGPFEYGKDDREGGEESNLFGTMIIISVWSFP